MPGSTTHPCAVQSVAKNLSWDGNRDARDHRDSYRDNPRGPPPPPGRPRGMPGNSSHQRDHQGDQREPGLHLLSAALRVKVDELLERHAGQLEPGHFDMGIVESLLRLGEVDGMAVLVELDSNELSGVRNMPAYMMGIIKRYQGGGRPIHGGRGGTRDHYY